MPAKISTKGRNVNIEDIWVDVQFQGCGNSYSVKMDRPKKIKNCHCGKGTFKFEVNSYPGQIVVNVDFSLNGFSFYSVEPLRVYLVDEDE